MQPLRNKTKGRLLAGKPQRTNVRSATSGAKENSKGLQQNLTPRVYIGNYAVSEETAAFAQWLPNDESDMLVFALNPDTTRQ